MAKQLTAQELEAVQAAYKVRTNIEWKALPVLACSCGQKVYQEHPKQEVCRDCMSNGVEIARFLQVELPDGVNFYADCKSGQQ